MLTRRDFLKGMLTLAAATVVNKNGVLRLSEEVETSNRTIFDMAQNTWREPKTLKLLVTYPYCVISFTSDQSELCFPPMIGGPVRFTGTDGKRDYIGTVLSMEDVPDGTRKYLVSLTTPAVFSGWQWASTC